MVIACFLIAPEEKACYFNHCLYRLGSKLLEYMQKSCWQGSLLRNCTYATDRLLRNFTDSLWWDLQFRIFDRNNTSTSFWSKQASLHSPRSKFSCQFILWLCVCSYLPI